ncbi:hypothetical protein BC629DRAFT_1439642 [Irpex lacteus]|nr:hypothetical protein BC629DRAFT_1439642 [Irpex lacteus]
MCCHGAGYNATALAACMGSLLGVRSQYDKAEPRPRPDVEKQLPLVGPIIPAARQCVPYIDEEELVHYSRWKNEDEKEGYPIADRGAWYRRMSAGLSVSVVAYAQPMPYSRLGIVESYMNTSGTQPSARTRSSRMIWMVDLPDESENPLTLLLFTPGILASPISSNEAMTWTARPSATATPLPHTLCGLC